MYTKNDYGIQYCPHSCTCMLTYLYFMSIIWMLKYNLNITGKPKHISGELEILETQ